MSAEGATLVRSLCPRTISLMKCGARFALIWLVLVSPAAAQSLRRFEEPRKSTADPAPARASSSRSYAPSTASMQPSRSGASDGCSSFCSFGVQSFIGALFSASSPSARSHQEGANGSIEPPASEPLPVDTSVTFPSTRSYDKDGAAQVYMTPWNKTQEAAIAEPYFRYDDRLKRHAEVLLSLFAPLRAPVFAAELGVRVHIKYVTLAGSWERFVEPRSRGRSDSLDLVRLRVGGNVLGGRSKSIELYPLLGAMYFRGPSVTTGAFDVGVEARVYPVYPIAILGSFSVLLFTQGQPLIDSRIEAGVALGPIDLRLGLRYLKQEPSESYVGPALTLVAKL